MKTKQIKVEKEIYICETCGMESESKYRIEQCEKNHADQLKYDLCEHEFTYESSIEWEGNDIVIDRLCPKCGFTDTVRVDEDDIDDKIAEALFYKGTS